MAWNRPSENKVKVNGEGERRIVRHKGLIACAIVVLGAAIAAWWLCSNDTGAGETTVHRSVRQIKEVNPAAVATTNRTTSGANEKPPVTTRVTHERWKPGMRPPNVPEGEAWKAGRTKIHGVIRQSVNANETVYHNATERMLVEVFTTEVGDPPVPIAQIPDEDRRRMLNILLDKNPPKEGDAEHVQMQKEVLAQAKKELQKFIRSGGDPDEFFKHYHDELVRAWQRRENTVEEVRRLAREEKDADTMKALCRRINEGLESDGIKPIHMTREELSGEDEEEQE